MPTAVEHGIGVKAIIAVLRKAGGDPENFGPSIQDVLLNFSLEEKNFGQEVKAGLLLPAVQEELGLLGVAPPDHDHGVFGV